MYLVIDLNKKRQLHISAIGVSWRVKNVEGGHDVDLALGIHRMGVDNRLVVFLLEGELVVGVLVSVYEHRDHGDLFVWLLSCCCCCGVGERVLLAVRLAHRVKEVQLVVVGTHFGARLVTD